MKARHAVSALALFAVLLLFAGPAAAFEILIDVSPNVLNIESQGQVVTIHTDIPYGEVDVSTVYMNGVPISSWKADARGFFVAKFPMVEIKGLDLVIDGYNTLTLVGMTTWNEAFWGRQDILVIDVIPSGR